MKKIFILIMLSLFIVGCNTPVEPDTEMDTSTNRRLPPPPPQQ